MGKVHLALADSKRASSCTAGEMTVLAVTAFMQSVGIQAAVCQQLSTAA